jgi:ribonuclease P protein component
MTKAYRLSRADFSSLKTLRKEQGKLFVLSVAKSPDNKPRFTCVVSKKIAHKAHERNLIKRRTRAAFREISPIAPLAYVFSAKRAAKDIAYAEVSLDVKCLVEKSLAGLKGVSELQ